MMANVLSQLNSRRITAQIRGRQVKFLHVFDF